MANISPYEIKKDTTLGYYNSFFDRRLFSSQKFRMYTVKENGQYVKEEFTENGLRTHLQTYLAQEVSDIPFGHYTNLLESWSSIFIPLVYPYIILCLSFLLLPFGFRFNSIQILKDVKSFPFIKQKL